MATMSVLGSDFAKTAELTVGGAIVGGIKQTRKDTWSVDTSGRVPAIDGLSGGSWREAWQAVVARVAAGGVMYYNQPVEQAFEPLADG